MLGLSLLALSGYMAGSPATAQTTTDELQLLEELYREQLISTAIYERRRAVLLNVTSRAGATYRLPDQTVLENPSDSRATMSIANGAEKPVADRQRIALLVGNNQYQSLPVLETAVNDIRAIADVLSHGFGFTVITMEDATRQQMLSALSHYRQKLTADDDFILYYAGHGIVDEHTGRGYWLPIDARLENPANWVSSVEISDVLFSMEARHALVVADSCFSSSLLQEPAPLQASASSRRLPRSRTLITSGSLEPVLDSGFGDHSVFAMALLDALNGADRWVSTTQLFERVRQDVLAHAEQTPQYGFLPGAGHTGGEFPLR
jgi:uncharacterized caspase-like protein